MKQTPAQYTRRALKCRREAMRLSAKHAHEAAPCMRANLLFRRAKALAAVARLTAVAS